MEDVMEQSGPYIVTKLADRLVPIPRDTEPPVSLYALCRAWVRNNPNAPLTVSAAPQAQRYGRDASAAATPEPAQAAGLEGTAAPSTSSGERVPDQQQQPLQPALHAREAEPQGQSDAGLLSILPPLLPPTPLETDTSPPTYPLDDFEPQEAEEAQRKLKDHWVAVRQYHQAMGRAKRSRCNERLRVLLGEPSSLQQPSLAPPQQLLLQQQMQPAAFMAGGAAAAAAIAAAQNPLQAALLHQQQQQQQQVLAAGLAGQVSLQGHPGLGSLSGLPVGLAGFAGIPGGLGPLLAGAGPGPGPLGLAGGPLAQGGAASGSIGTVGSADAQAALAVLASLGQVPVLSVGSLEQQQQQAGGHPAAALAQGLLQLQQQQHQAPQQPPSGSGGAGDVVSQQLGLLLANGGATGPMDMLLALQQQQQQQLPQQLAVATSASQQQQQQQQQQPAEAPQAGQPQAVMTAAAGASAAGPAGADAGAGGSGSRSLGGEATGASDSQGGAAVGAAGGMAGGGERMDVDSAGSAGGAQT